MLGLAVHLSIGVFIALTFLFVEAFTMVLNVKPPMKFYTFAWNTMITYFAFSFLIGLSLIWG